MKLKTAKPCAPEDVARSGAIFLAAAFLLAVQPTLAQSASSQAKMSQMLDQIEQGKRPSYASGGGRQSNMGGYANKMGGSRPSNMGGYANTMSGGRPSNMGSYANTMGGSRPSNMGGYANMTSGGRPSNMGGYAAMGSRGGSSQMLQLMKQKISRMQSGGAPGPLMQLMRQRSSAAPNMMPAMGGGPGASMGMQSGLFAKMMQQESALNNTKIRQPMSRGMGMSGGMQQKPGAPRASAPLPAKTAAPAGTPKMSDLEKQMESQYGK